MKTFCDAKPGSAPERTTPRPGVGPGASLQEPAPPRFDTGPSVKPMSLPSRVVPLKKLALRGCGRLGAPGVISTR